jgi:hypothetical protein
MYDMASPAGSLAARATNPARSTNNGNPKRSAQLIRFAVITSTSKIATHSIS